MKLLRLIFISIILLLISACASAPKAVKAPKKWKVTSQRLVASGPCRSIDSKKEFSINKWIEAGNNCLFHKNWKELAKIAEAVRFKFADSPWGFFYQSFVDQNAKNIRKALWMSERAYKIGKEEAEEANGALLFQWIVLNWESNDRRKAFELATECIETVSEPVECHLFLAQVHLISADYDESFMHLSKSLQMKPDSPLAKKISDSLRESGFENPKLSALSGGGQ